MPGIVGFSSIAQTFDSASSKAELERMRDLLTHDPRYVCDKLYCAPNLSASRVHLGVLECSPQPWSNGTASIWMDGEIYESETPILHLNGEPIPKSSVELLGRLYVLDPAFGFLKSLNGLFSAVIADHKRQLLHLISDRYGIRLLYFTELSNRIAWSSELKGFLGLKEFSPRIDPQAVTEFMGIGYLLEDGTWFENVHALPSGSVLTWDLKANKRKGLRRYWWWSDITPLPSSVSDVREVAEELGRLLVQSVTRRSTGNATIGLLLSGGLDSRAILAALPLPSDAIHTFTLGAKSCDDVRIAAKATLIKGGHHHIGELSAANWINMRREAVWWTDGLLPFHHFHGVEFLAEIRKRFAVNLSGYLGDLVLGGSYLNDSTWLDTPVTIACAAKQMACPEALLTCVQTYVDLPKRDFFFIQNRGRRFVTGGLRHIGTSTEYRLPFFDNQLLDFSYGLPDQLRYRSKIYNIALLSRFPEFFRHIPWQKTGAPISWPNYLIEGNKVLRRVNNRLTKIIGRTSRRNFVDYPNWIRTEPGRSFFQATLGKANPAFESVLSPDIVRQTLQSHLEGEDKTNLLGCMLTLALWMERLEDAK